MRELLECLQGWLLGDRADGSAYSLLSALTRETLKRVDSADPAQREFDAEALAHAAGRPVDFEAAKRWIDRAKFELFAESRRNAIEQHFRESGHHRALRVVRRSPRGKHRAVWFLESYPLQDEAEVPAPTDPTDASEPAASPQSIEYDFTPPGKVRAAWFAQPLIGKGGFVTRSWRGLVWVAVFLVPILYLLFSAVVALGYMYTKRPLQTSDTASMLILATFGWVVWRISIRPVVWLLDDRITTASELWVAWGEDRAQLELSKDAVSKRQTLQLVRYSAVCPVCAGTIELRYSQGPNRRRLVGCCNEAPHEHVFSFDRVLRAGQRMHSA